MKATDALEVVRKQLETLRNLVPDIEADSLADTALAVLTNLVDRAGEPVAWQVRSAFKSGGWYGWSQAQSESDAVAQVARYRELGIDAEWRALSETTPAAPGASHER